MKKTRFLAALVLTTLVILGITFVNAATTYTYGDFKYTVSNGKITISQYTGNSKTVTIPALINNNPVYSVGSRAFDNNTTVEKVVIPEGIIGIEKYTFYKCTNLSNVVLPQSLAYINGPVKYKCDKLTVNIPEGFEELNTPIKQKYRKDITTVNISGTYDYDYAKRVFELTNEERKKAGLKELSYDNELTQAALLRVAETAIYADHERPTLQNFTTSIEDIGYTLTATSYSENLCAGYTTPEAAVTGWMNSPGHRANILKAESTNIGVGVFATDNAIYWIQVFSNGTTSKPCTLTGTNRTSVKVQVATGIGVLSYVQIDGLQDNINVKVGESVGPTKVSVANTQFFNYLSKVQTSDVTWTTSNRFVASVTTNGTIKGVKPGTATITAKLGEFTKTYEVNVTGSTGTSGSTMIEEGELGDINMDGKVNAEDAAMVLDIYKGLVEVSAAQFELGDINGDGNLTVEDAGLILDIFKGLR